MILSSELLSSIKGISTRNTRDLAGLHNRVTAVSLDNLFIPAYALAFGMLYTFPEGKILTYGIPDPSGHTYALFNATRGKASLNAMLSQIDSRARLQSSHPEIENTRIMSLPNFLFTFNLSTREMSLLMSLSIKTSVMENLGNDPSAVQDSSNYLLIINKEAFENSPKLRTKLLKFYITPLISTNKIDMLYTDSVEKWVFNPIPDRLLVFEDMIEEQEHLKNVRKIFYGN